jgi:hypothetical protein
MPASGGPAHRRIGQVGWPTDRWGTVVRRRTSSSPATARKPYALAVPDRYLEHVRANLDDYEDIISSCELCIRCVAGTGGRGDGAQHMSEVGRG